MKRLGIVLLLPLFALSLQAAEKSDEWNQNWPHWRGPLLTGEAPNADPPVEWSEDKNIKWKVDLPGEGTATPIIWGDRLFILTAVDTGKRAETPAAENASAAPQEEEPAGGRRRGGGRFSSPGPQNIFQFIVLCFDRNTGEEMWRKVAVEEAPHEGHHATGSNAAPSPMTDGESLFASFGSRGIFCYSLDGELKWKQDLGDMRISNRFGEGSSPYVYKDSLLVNWDHEGDSFLYRLDKKTGDVIWKVERDEGTTWSSPIVAEWEGKSQVIVNGTKRTRSYDFEKGELIWAHGGQTSNAIPTPIVDDGIVFATSGFRGAALKAIPLDAKGDITGTDQVKWAYDQDTPYVPSPLLYDDRLYFLKTNSAILTIVDSKTGEAVVSASRLPDLGGTVYASPAGAGGKVYIVNREGSTLVMEHGDSINKIALNQLNDTIDASPAFVGNYLYLRGRDSLYCIEKK